MSAFRGNVRRINRAKAEALIQQAIDALDTLDADADMEPDAEGEDGGDAEENGDMELEPGELDLSDNEPSHNAPVSGAQLGQAAWRPGPMPAQPAQFEPVPVIPAVRVVQEPPEGYQALHPETKYGSNQETRGAQTEQPSFAADTASKTRQSRPTVQRDAERDGYVAIRVLKPDWRP